MTGGGAFARDWNIMFGNGEWDRSTAVRQVDGGEDGFGCMGPGSYCKKYPCGRCCWGSAPGVSRRQGQ